jgi:hypothetical protein
LQRPKKEIVDAAVREYVAKHREDIQNNALEALRLLDGTTKSAVSLVTGTSADELNELGGFEK